MMKSPFPGMDPYLEKRWSNVHVLMMSAITALLNRSLPSGLEARPEEEVRIETIAGERMHGYRPDVTIIDSGSDESPVTQEGGGIAVAEPIRITFHRGPIVLRNVQIVDSRDRDRVVTVIEVLSPWNKLPGQLNKDYIAKLDAMEQADASWVEIDLLRSSRSNLSVTWEDLPAQKRLDYLVLAYNTNALELWGYPISMRQQLPTIRIPLREDDPQIHLDLQAVLTRVREDGRFSFDYSKPLVPPLSVADEAWLSSRGKTSD